MAYLGCYFQILCKCTKTVTNFWIGPTSASSLTSVPSSTWVLKKVQTSNGTIKNLMI